jgi:predicted ribosome quality control (RQC) complex YloA/Tae2 family protein
MANSNDRGQGPLKKPVSASGSAPLLAPLEEAKGAARALLVQKRKRLQRRVKAVQGDLARGVEAQALAEKARWFVALAGRARRGTLELKMVDPSTGLELTLPIDPTRSAREELDTIFNLARRMQRGMEVARARMAEAEAEIRVLEGKLEAILAATSEEELEAAIDAPEPPRVPAPARKKPAKGKQENPTRRPYRLFKTTLGAPILVGRGAADNDDLTFHVARPRDLWLHARGIEGAHVIVPLDKGKEPSAEALVDAAHLAAHFSGHRAEATVEIDYAPRGRVRKPRRSPPGLVVVDRAKALLVRIEKERLARLLKSEDV